MFSSFLPEPPPFSIAASRYDQSTLLGRVLRSYSLTDVRTLFYSKNDLTNAILLLDRFRENRLPTGTTVSQLWQAKKTVESMVHPVTGEIITPIFRFGAYAPVNIVLVSAMLLPSTINSVSRTILVHWFNQSYNCAVNYANRSGDSADPEAQASATRSLIQGYVAAVGTSLGIALGAQYYTKRVKVGPFIRATVPFTAVVLAGWANILCMRRQEWMKGSPVFEEDGTVVGESKVAGQSGLLKCCTARFLWNVPGMVVPGAILGWLGSKPFYTRQAAAVRMAVETSLVAVCLWAGVPPALALFPQIEKLPVEDLEEEFRDLVSAFDKKPVTHLYYNKGL